jgi:hypothetical protein
MDGSGLSQGRGHICPEGHELRITRRCLEEDLGEDPDECEFGDLCETHPIVHAFRERRSKVTGGGDTVGPAAGEWTIFTLRQGSDHRGATWYDAKSGVVWLLAAGHHRSGQPDDAFQRFRELLAEEAIYPLENDLEDFYSDRGDEFVERARVAVPTLLAEAQADPGSEFAVQIGTEPVSCVINVVETLQERYFAVSGHVGVQGLELLKALFAPDRRHEEWRSEPRLPTRELDFKRSEMCFSVVIA